MTISPSILRRSLLLPIGLLALSAGGCATTGTGFGPRLDPSEIPLLEQDLARDGADLDVLVRLAAIHQQSGRPNEALPLLERALQLSPGHPPAIFYLGLTHEDLDNWDRASDAYAEYLRLGSDAQLRTEAERRAGLMERRKVEEEIRATVAREAELGGSDPDRSVVAVFPFRWTGSDPELRPLGRALAEMLVTDLSVTNRIRVLERLRVQLLLDEIALSEQGMTDRATATRGGRLLGAGQIVQGELGGGEQSLSIEAAVVPVRTEGVEIPDPIRESDPLERFFDTQKRLALSLYESLGVSLTPAEIEVIQRRPTQNIQALLAYGLALEAEDRGDFDEASRFFSEAVRLDTGFEEARVRADLTAGFAESLPIPTVTLGQQAAPRILADLAGADAMLQQESVAELERLLPHLTPRDAVPEVQGTEGIGVQPDVKVDIIIRRPGQ